MSKRRILVTGATGGIGAAVVAHLLAAGHILVAADRVEAVPPAGATAENFHSLLFDIRETAPTEAAIERGVALVGGLDALINVAGICYGGDPETATPEEWDTTFDVNVKGMFQLTRAALPHLQKNPRADIVNISSIWGVDHTHALLSYSASKFAVEGYTGGLRKWGMPRNIRVCAIQVDKVDTGFRQNLGAAGEFPLDKLARMLSPNDVAEAVAFVLSTHDTAQISNIRLDAPLWYQQEGSAP